MTKTTWFACVSAFFAVFALRAETFYVATPANGGSDATGDGSSAKPYATVVKGFEELQKVDSAGTLSVGEGTFDFTEVTPRSLGIECGYTALILTNAITIAGAGMDKTVFRLAVDETVYTCGGRILTVKNKNAVVKDLTIRDCWCKEWFWYGLALYVSAGTVERVRITQNDPAVVQYAYGAVVLDGGDAKLVNCKIDDNGNKFLGFCSGGAVSVKHGLVANCLIANNRTGEGGGLRVAENAKIRNCTVVNNRARYVNSSTALAGGVAFASTSGVEVRNTVFCGNTAEYDNGLGGNGDYSRPSTDAEVATLEKLFHNCAFTDGTTPIGENAQTVRKSEFQDFAAENFVLRTHAATVDAGSACADLGEFDLAQNVRIQNEVVDIGAYEANPETFEAGITVGSETVLLGDALTATASVPAVFAGDAFTYAWTVKNASGAAVFTSTEMTLSCVPTDSGTYSIELTVTDTTAGKQSLRTVSDAVSVAPPVIYVTCRENAKAAYPWGSLETAATDLVEVVARAIPGQTIVLDEGVHTVGDGTGFDAITLEKRLTVRGAGIDRTFVEPKVYRYSGADYGRAFCLKNADAKVEKLTIRKGRGAWSWYTIEGGMGAIVYAGTISECRICECSYNQSQQLGGAVWLQGTSARLTHSIVNSNGWECLSSIYAGGVYVTEGTVDDCLIFGNRSWRGAGIGVGKNGKVWNCTVADNSAIALSGFAYTGMFGGVWIAWKSYGDPTSAMATGADIRNTVFIGNYADMSSGSAGGYEYEVPDSKNATVWSGSFHNCAFTEGVTPVGENGVAARESDFRNYGARNYRLNGGTALVDGGVTYAGIADTDFDGKDRIQGEAPDIGAYEFNPNAFACTFSAAATELLVTTPVRLTASVTGLPAGHSVTYAWTVSNTCGTVTYDGDASVFERTVVAGVYDVSLVVSDVTDPSAEPASYDQKAFLTVMPETCYVTSKENPDTAFPWDTPQNAATDLGTVVAQAIPGQTIVLDEGVHTVGDGTGFDAITLEKRLTVRGAGMDRTFVEPRVYRYNNADYGRAFCLRNADAKVEKLTMRKCFGAASWTDSEGGMAALVYAGTISDCRVCDCSYNQTQQRGGAVWLQGTSARLTHSIVNSNGWSSLSSLWAGGVYVEQGTVDNCLVFGNRAWRGAGIGVGENGKVWNCTVADNSAVALNGVNYSGMFGGVWISWAPKSQSDPTSAMVTGADIRNTVFIGNHADKNSGSAGGEEYETPASVNAATWEGSFHNCAFTEGVMSVGENGVAARESDFRNYDARNYRLNGGTALVDGGVTHAGIADTDLDGKARSLGEAPDIGAYEFDPNAFACAFSADATEILGSAKVRLTASVTGLPAGHSVSYAWTVASTNGTVTYDGDASVFERALDAGVYDVSLTVSDATDPSVEPVNYERKAFLAVMPETCYVTSKENPNAAFPWDTWATASTSLYEVVSSAIGGMKIELDAGVHTIGRRLDMDAITLSKAVTVSGQGSDVTIVEPNVCQAQTSFGTKWIGRAFVLRHVDARVEKMTIRKCYGDPAVNYTEAIGGLAVIIYQGTLADCRVCDSYYDRSACPGGVVWIDGASAKAERCIIDHNGWIPDGYYAGYIGGAVFVRYGLLENCLVYSNAFSRGAGLMLREGARVRNCTVALNRAASGAYAGVNGGVYVRPTTDGSATSPLPGDVRVENTVFVGNAADTQADTLGGGEYVYPTYEPQIAVLTGATFSNCVWGVATDEGLLGQGARRVVCSTNAADLAELFKAPTEGDFHAAAESPIINAGRPDADWADAATDLDGRPRVKHVDRKGRRLIDAGCYESKYRPNGLLLIVR